MIELSISPKVGEKIAHISLFIKQIKSFFYITYCILHVHNCASGITKHSIVLYQSSKIKMFIFKVQLVIVVLCLLLGHFWMVGLYI